MTTEPADFNLPSIQNDPAPEAYEPPLLIRHGTLVELTRSTGIYCAEDYAYASFEVPNPSATCTDAMQAAFNNVRLPPK